MSNQESNHLVVRGTMSCDKLHHKDFTPVESETCSKKLDRRDTSTSWGLDQVLQSQECGEITSKAYDSSSKPKIFHAEEHKELECHPISMKSNHSTWFSHRSNGSEIDGEENNLLDHQKDESLDNSSETLTLTLSPAKKSSRQFNIDSVELPISRRDWLEEFSCKRIENMAAPKIEQGKTETVTAPKGKNSSRGTELKNLLREFKKFYIRDFASFEKASGNLKSANKGNFCEKVQKYLDSKLIINEGKGGDLKADWRLLHYSLGLIINPKLALNWEHWVKPWTVNQNECQILIQDLIFRFTLTKAKEFISKDDNKALFNHFLHWNGDKLTKFQAEIAVFKSLL